MTELAKVDAHTARSVAGQIRQGIHDYLATLALISKAWEEGHWHVLSYDSWQAYVDGEFGADRLRLPAEHRAKAVAELRLAGMSTRAIGSALGVSHTEVGRQLRSGGTDVPPEVQGTDGKRYAASRPQTPATSPEPEPDGVDVASSGHNLPSPDDDLAAGRSQRFDSVEEMDAALDAATSGPDFGDALDRLVPDSNPHREWQSNFLRAVGGVNRLMLFTPADVAERADQQCLDELIQVADRLATWRAEAVHARILATPDNVRPIRRIS